MYSRTLPLLESITKDLVEKEPDFYEIPADPSDPDQIPITIPKGPKGYGGDPIAMMAKMEKHSVYNKMTAIEQGKLIADSPSPGHAVQELDNIQKGLESIDTKVMGVEGALVAKNYPSLWDRSGGNTVSWTPDTDQSEIPSDQMDMPAGGIAPSDDLSGSDLPLSFPVMPGEPFTPEIDLGGTIIGSALGAVGLVAAGKLAKGLYKKGAELAMSPRQYHARYGKCPRGYNWIKNACVTTN